MYIYLIPLDTINTSNVPDFIDLALKNAGIIHLMKML